MKIGKVLFSVIVAASAGFAIGILAAPEKGSRTRRNIREKGQYYVEDKAEDLHHFINGLKRKIEHILDALPDKIVNRNGESAEGQV